MKHLLWTNELHQGKEQLSHIYIDYLLSPETLLYMYIAYCTYCLNGNQYVL